MSAAHTPGPWVVSWSGNVKTEAGELIACVWPDDGKDKDQYFGNARLIAAAPDLLDALVLLVAGVENSCSDTFVPLVKAKAAIAKAEGLS